MAYVQEFNPIDVVNKGLSYKNWLEDYPLYLHNHRQYYKNTLNNYQIDPIKIAKEKAILYINLLEEREKKILSGSENPEKALQLIAQEGFVNNENINKIIELLDKIFLKNILKTSVVTKEEKTYFRLTFKNNVKEVFLPKIGKDNNEFNSNIYDYDNIKIDQKIEEELKQLVLDIQNAVNENNGISKELEKVLNKSELKDTIQAPDFLKYLNFISNYNENETSSGQLVKFFVDAIGLYISLRGRFVESSKLKYKNDLQKLIKGNLQMYRRDFSNKYKSTTKLTKVDNIIYGGIIKAPNPLTISRKVMTTRGAIKFHEGSLWSIYEALNRDDSKTASLFLYVLLNNPFWGEENDGNFEKIKLIIKFMSYIFLSGNINDKPENQAIYLVITAKQTKRNGGGIATKFIPFSVLLKIILGWEEGFNFGKEIPINLDIKDVKRPSNAFDIMNELWIEKLGAAGKNDGKLKYANLAPDPSIQEFVMRSRRTIFKKPRKITISYPQIEKGMDYYMKKTGII